MFKSKKAAPDNLYETLVKKATNENLVNEDWEVMLDISDSIQSEKTAKECFDVIILRLSHKNVNVLFYTLTLMEMLFKNCSFCKGQLNNKKLLQRFEDLLKSETIHNSAKDKLLKLIQNWFEDYKEDECELDLFVDFYDYLKEEGYQFIKEEPNKNDKNKTKAQEEKLKAQKEEEEFQLALALSLSEQNKNKESINKTQATVQRNSEKQETGYLFKVRACFDFKKSETGELSFHKDDIITVVNDNYEHWWKGHLNGEYGIFPSNYVEKISESDNKSNPHKTYSRDEEKDEKDDILELEESVQNEKNYICDMAEDDSFSKAELELKYKALKPKLDAVIDYYSKQYEELEDAHEKITKALKTYHGL